MFSAVKEPLTGLKDVGHHVGGHEVPTQMGTGETIGALLVLRQATVELSLWYMNNTRKTWRKQAINF